MSKDDEVNEKRRKLLLRHLDNVRNNCIILGEKLIEAGEAQLGRQLIANGYIHDNSKFYGNEWEYLHPEVKEEKPELFEAAVKQHSLTNKHHPEFWGGIHEMPRLYVAEMVCDWAARSSEFGNDLREWIKDSATKKFGMTVQSKRYKEIKELVNLLLEPTFK